MNFVWELSPYLIAMLVLIGCSSFFSASEASLFYLRPLERLKLLKGTRTERVAGGLLLNPERLLSAVLFWNLVVNVIYFAIGSICALKLERQYNAGAVTTTLFALVTLMLIIFFSEMLPKTIAVLMPQGIAKIVSVPLAVAVRIVDPIMPVLQTVQRISRRIIWPSLQSERYLEIADLERAILLSGEDAELIKQEQAVLQNVVHLSEIRIDEWMSPRTQVKVFKPPVTLASLNGALPNSGYLIISEPESEEIAKAIHIDQLIKLPSQAKIDRYAEPVLYLPWNSTVADALEKMSKRDHEVVAVVNEYGDTVGVLTVDDVLESIFSYSPSRSQRLLDQIPLRKLGHNRWAVSGMMSLKRLARKLHVNNPETYSVTVAGVIEETVQRVMQEGDECEWGPFQFRVRHAPTRFEAEIEVSLKPTGEQL